MSETVDPLKDVHSPELWDHSFAYLDRDFARVGDMLQSLPPNSPEAIVVKELGAVALAVLRHQEVVLRQVALDTAPPPPKPPRKPRTPRAKVVITEEGNE
jgi:hypothetical protein